MENTLEIDFKPLTPFCAISNIGGSTYPLLDGYSVTDCPSPAGGIRQLTQ
jgi:hypothetical protein